jgi:DNA-binding XRE family transcriptional regulator
MIVKSTFAEKLKEHRKFFEVTQAELAKELGISKRTIEYWEHGQRAPRAVVQSEALRATSIVGYRKYPQEYFAKKAYHAGSDKSEKPRRLKPTRKPKIGGAARE